MFWVLWALAWAGEYDCATYTSESFTENQRLDAYCDSTGTAVNTDGSLQCKLVSDDATSTWTVKCICKTDFVLPDCSLDVSHAETNQDTSNTTPNTCLLEDILAKNAWKNDFTKYTHYVH